jgi:hypothetical protein
MFNYLNSFPFSIVIFDSLLASDKQLTSFQHYRCSFIFIIRNDQFFDLDASFLKDKIIKEDYDA